MAVKTFTAGETANAADTNTYLANSGLVYVGAASVSGATSFFLDSCFSSTYDSYRVLYTATAAGGGAADITMKLRTVSGDDSSSIYSYARFYGYSNGATVLLNTGESGTSAYVGTQLSGGVFSLDIYNANRAYLTSYVVQATGFQASSPFAFNNTSTGTINSSTQYTGIKFLAASNMTGTLTVYGYRKA